MGGNQNPSPIEQETQSPLPNENIGHENDNPSDIVQELRYTSNEVTNPWGC